MSFKRGKIATFLLTLKPTYWQRISATDRMWDKKLNELMDKYSFEYLSEYEAKLGDQYVWVQNHPYASFTPTEGVKDEGIRYFHRILREKSPSRRTVIRAYDKYKEEVLDKRN